MTGYDYYSFRIESKHEVTILGGLNEFYVKFFGPSGSKLITPLYSNTHCNASYNYHCVHCERSVLVQV